MEKSNHIDIVSLKYRLIAVSIVLAMCLSAFGIAVPSASATVEINSETANTPEVKLESYLLSGNLEDALGMPIPFAEIAVENQFERGRHNYSQAYSINTFSLSFRLDTVWKR